MSIAIRCAECGENAEVPDTAAGARGKCRACGAAVQVPPKVPKVCCACGINVSGQPRTKDEQGRYYCNPCWTARDNKTSEADADPTSSDELLACPQCGGVFGIDEMDVSGVCIRCATQPAGSHAQHGKNGASKSSFWRSEIGVITAIVAPVVLIGIAVVVWLLWSSHAERRIRHEIARMKTVSDQRLAAGDAEVASKQFAELLAYVAEEEIEDDALGTLAEVRRQKDAADAKVAQLVEGRRQEQQRRETAAGNKFVNDVNHFLAASKAFRTAYDEYSRRGKAIVGVEDIKAAMDSERQMLDAMDALAKEAKGVQSAYDAIPKDLDHTLTLCNLIGAAAVDLTTAYNKNSSAPGDMARLRLARMTGASADVDPQATQRNYAALVSGVYAMAGIAVDTAAIIHSDPTPNAPQHRATSLPPGDGGGETEERSGLVESRAITQVYLADLKETAIECWTDPAGRMVFHKRVSDWNDTPISVNGKPSPNGLFTHPPERGKATVRYALDGTYDTFGSEVGIADNNDPQPQSAVTFKLIGDGKVLWTSPAIQAKGRTVECSADIRGVKQLELVAEAAGSHYFAHAVWVEPHVTRAGSSPIANGVTTERSTAPTASKSNAADDPAKCQDAGEAYRRGVEILKTEGAQTNAPLGIRWLQRSAELQHAPAATVLGELYRNGTFVQQDASAGAKWFRKGADGGDVEAMTLFAICLAKGEGLERNLPEAAKWYRAAADKSDVRAMHNLAVMYLQGDGVAQSEEEGRKLLRRAAEGGNTMSMKVFGQVVDKKQNGAISRNPENAEEATQLARKAWQYRNGKDVAKDETAAFQWYKKAADLGNGDAMFKVGAMYANGTGHWTCRSRRTPPETIFSAHRRSGSTGHAATRRFSERKKTVPLLRRTHSSGGQKVPLLRLVSRRQSTVGASHDFAFTSTNGGVGQSPGGQSAVGSKRLSPTYSRTGTIGERGALADPAGSTNPVHASVFVGLRRGAL